MTSMETRVRDRLNGSRPATRRVDLAPLLGGWLNYDATATGIARVDIGDRNGALTVRAFGANGPEPVDWGEAFGAAYSGGVGDTEAIGFTADHNTGFARVLLAAYLNKRLLVIDAYTIFTDESGRANYFQRDHFYLP